MKKIPKEWWESKKKKDLQIGDYFLKKESNKKNIYKVIGFQERHKRKYGKYQRRKIIKYLQSIKVNGDRKGSCNYYISSKWANDKIKAIKKEYEEQLQQILFLEAL